MEVSKERMLLSARLNWPRAREEVASEGGAGESWWRQADTLQLLALSSVKQRLLEEGRGGKRRMLATCMRTAVDMGWGNVSASDSRGHVQWICVEARRALQSV